MNAKRRISHILARMPVLTLLMRAVFRVTQAHFTAGVVGVVFNNTDEILIVEHVYHPGNPWGLPGGWLGRTESPSEGLQRELMEETGLEIQIIRPILVQAGVYFKGHIDISYLCRAKGDVRKLSAELLDYRWAHIDALPHMLPFHRASVAAAWSQRLDEEIVF